MQLEFEFVVGANRAHYAAGNENLLTLVSAKKII